MNKEEFNLSDFIRSENTLNDTNIDVIIADDVKEFIQLLKEEFAIGIDYKEYRIFKIIDKLAGDKLK
jgi:hypothetical protein